MSKKIKVTLVKSVIGRPERQRKVIQTLGLRKLNSSVIHEDTPAIRGMVNAVSHLVEVKEIEA
ncbi:MAG: 50S ribosomal protein L30 [Clostridia bacterium]|nr:50S ribosomal protein L30 [Clostridia bacterium]